MMQQRRIKLQNTVVKPCSIYIPNLTSGKCKEEIPLFESISLSNL